jgi:hypothetical protein
MQQRWSKLGEHRFFYEFSRFNKTQPWICQTKAKGNRSAHCYQKNSSLGLFSTSVELREKNIRMAVMENLLKKKKKE